MFSGTVSLFNNNLFHNNSPIAMYLPANHQNSVPRTANTFLLLTGLFLYPALFAQKNTVIPVETSQHALVL